MRRSWKPLLVLLALALLPRAASAQEEILFVFGSDTSTPGIRVDRYAAVYPASGFGMFADPARQGYGIMDPQLRERYRDSYGTPLKLTWWMQGGSLYRPALNTNVPLPSTMSTHLMYRHHREAMEQFGDEMTFHFHTWLWTDYDVDGRYYWNQAKSFGESREDFDRSLAEHLIEEDLFPVSFRSGWHYMDDRWQARLDSLLPFSLHNAWPGVRSETTEPIDNVYDWSRSPRDFVPYQPSPEDYQRPGGTRGWNAGSVYMKSVNEDFIRGIFEAARAGERQVVTIWSHLAEADFVDQVEAAAEAIERVSADYSDVPFRYATGVEAMQRWLGGDDRTPPAVALEEESSGGQVVLRIRTDEPLFQPVPFAALMDRYDRYRPLEVIPVGPEAWETEPFDAADAAHVAVAATDTSGNLTTEHLRYLPDDIYVDNEDAGYEEVAGAWTSATGRNDAQVWGRGYRVATLEDGSEAVARWRLAIAEEAAYNVFVRVPDDDLAAAAFDVALRVNGAVVESTAFDEPPPPAEWTYAGTVDLRPGDDNVIEVRASGQEGRVLVADAVKLSAKIHERRLVIASDVLDFGEVIVDRTTPAVLPVRNTGTGVITISDVSSGSGIVTTADALPIVLGPMESIHLPLQISDDRQGEARDTLIIRSDDPVEPVKRVAFEVRVIDYFTTLDDTDPQGYAEEGGWQTSVTEAYGDRSRYAFTDAGASAAFSGTVERAGVYAWSYLVPLTENAAVRARYVLSVDDIVLDTLLVDQNAGSGSWRALGLYRLEEGERYRIEISWADLDQQGRVLRADAVRLFRVGGEVGELVLDNDDGGGAYEEEGTWSQSVSQESHGPTSRFMPAEGSGSATFRTTITRSGMHGIYEIVPTTVNAAQRAVYRISRNGSRVDSVFVDQNEGSGAWRFLTAVWFAEGDEAAVEVAHRGPAEPGRVLRADAVQFVFGAEAATAAEQAPERDAFALSANHPNPVHQTTRFTFTLEGPAAVRIALFDLLGREVARVVEGNRGAGIHTVDFDASGLSSGLYFCRMDAGGFSATRAWTVAR